MVVMCWSESDWNSEQSGKASLCAKLGEGSFELLEGGKHPSLNLKEPKGTAFMYTVTLEPNACEVTMPFGILAGIDDYP